nr:uncharacterized protein LOC123770247 isoform X2 [Procambarus clarkii]
MKQQMAVLLRPMLWRMCPRMLVEERAPEPMLKTSEALSVYLEAMWRTRLIILGVQLLPLLMPHNLSHLLPFERMEATVHKDLITELGLASDNGIFITLHQHGIARGVRVTETGPDQIVVSGSLVELLASRDMILLEIQKIRGLPPSPQTDDLTGTREVGVMCELIPSPPTARYASSLGLDRSARRYHSVLSRPLSPEPRPQRRKSRKHLMTNSKFRNTDKQHIPLLRSFSNRIFTKYSNQTSRKLESNIKIEKDVEEKLTRQNYLNSQEHNPKVEILLGDLKTEPECDETIIVSNINNPEIRDHGISHINYNKSVVVNKTNENLTLSSITKDSVLKSLDDRGVQFSGCEGMEGSNNKENIDNVFVKKVEEKDEEEEEQEEEEEEEDEEEEEEEEEGIDMDVENDKMICEPEISISEGHEALLKDHCSEEVKFKFSCKICSYKSMRENHFVKHMQLHDKGLALYQCNECNFVSIRASHLRRHRMSHAQQVLNCHLCAYTCDDQKLLSKHTRVKHKKAKQPKPIGSVFECDECEYKTSWHNAFQRHRRTHSPSKMIVMHTCPQCPYKTVRREHFLRHIENVHQNYRPFLCDICGKAFKRQDALKQHYVSHYQKLAEGSSGQVGPYGFVCHICQKICRSAAYLKEHMATHSEERSFLCEVCGASFKTRSVQRNHVQTIHRRPRAFTCPACEKKFNTKFALRRHMKQHDTNIDDGDELPSITRTSKMSGSSRIRELQQSAGSMNHPKSSVLQPSSRSKSAIRASSIRSSSHPPPSAYQITIDGQPAFLLPHIDDHHASIEDSESSIIEGNSTVLVEANDTSGTELGPLAAQGGGEAVSVQLQEPTTVHIVNQDALSAGSGDLILAADQYQSSRGSSVVPGDTTNYVDAEHGNSTLLYLTANFH